VLILGGFYAQRARPEVEAINFTPRVLDWLDSRLAAVR
jgi:hypothetical protein